jgi:glycosyltransferase involved in cell wall biosynthesis
MSFQTSGISVLHVATALTWRGGEQQVAYLAGELQKKGIRQMVLCSEGSAMQSYCRQEHIPCTAASKRSSVDLFFALKIKSLCRKNDFSLVHTHDSHALTFAVMAAVAGNRAKIIVSRRVDFPVSANFISRYKYNHSSVARILCVSEEIRRVMLPVIRDPLKLVTIHSGIDVSRFRGKQASGILHREYNIPEGCKIVGNISALAPHKDYPTFVRTARRLSQTDKGVRFFIIGDGPEKERIASLVSSEGIQDVVVMTGFRTDIADVMPELDVMLITSATEGLGTTILDAFACGVPVVATAAGGIPEMIVDGRTGLLASVGDDATLAEKTHRLLSDPALREQLTDAARKSLEAFSKEATAARTLTEYLAVTGSAL